METGKTEYILHNFTPVNDFIDEEKKYSTHFRKYKISRLFRTYALYGSFLIIALAILILFLSLAYYYYKIKPDALIINNFNQKYMLNKDQALNDHENFKKILELTKELNQNNNFSSDKNTQSNQKNRIITQTYTIFHSTFYNDILRVTTRHNYEPDNYSGYPNEQSCYISVSVGSSIEKGIIELSKKSIYGINENSYDAIDQNSKTNITRKEFQEAKTLCEYI